MNKTVQYMKTEIEAMTNKHKLGESWRQNMKDRVKNYQQYAGDESENLEI